MVGNQKTDPREDGKTDMGACEKTVIRNRSDKIEDRKKWDGLVEAANKHKNFFIMAEVI